MPLPRVYPKRKKWYEKTAGGKWEIDEKKLEDIAKDKQLFKITDKGEVIIDYPPIKPEIDEEE